MYLVHPFIVAGQIATGYYFSHFLIILPLSGIIDNIVGKVGMLYFEDDDDVNNNEEEEEEYWPVGGMLYGYNYTIW
jgi:hypothetical protein